MAAIPQFLNPVTGQPGISDGDIRSNDTNPNVGQFGPVRDGGATNHNGIDILAPEGTDIHAAATGTVVFAGQAGNYGNVVYIDHGNGIQTRYAHLSDTNVNAGDQVGAGDVIGSSGTTGNAQGLPTDEQHVHFEVRQGDSQSVKNEDTTPQDPTGYLGDTAPDNTTSDDQQ
jgi:murein DD-endopeptidase MepM/ murein hydrolase activator NlpD